MRDGGATARAARTPVASRPIARRPRPRFGVAGLALLGALVPVACGRDVTSRDVSAARTAASPAVPTTASVPASTTTTGLAEREPEEHWTASDLCVRDGAARPGGGAIVAIWDRSFALACGAIVDSATGERTGWLAVSNAVTLANNAVVGWRDVAKSPTFAGGREYVMLNASGRVAAPYGVLPADVAGRTLTSWLPSTQQGVFLGLWNVSWFDEGRSSGASGLAGSGSDLWIHDSRTGETRKVDPSTQFRTSPADLGQWWVVNGQLLLSGRVMGVKAIDPMNLSVLWERTPAELGGVPVAASLDFGQLASLPVATRAGAVERHNLDVRTGEVDRSATANAVVRGTVQVPLTGGFAVHGITQIFVNNGFAAAVRNGAQLWSYPNIKGPCDFAELPVAGSSGLVMACPQFAAYQRA